MSTFLTFKLYTAFVTIVFYQIVFNEVLSKADMVHSASGWMQGMQVKLWHHLRTCAIPECLRGVFTTRHYTNPCLSYLTLLYLTLPIYLSIYLFV